MKENILISTPVDVEFEMLTIACAIHLLNSLLTNRFRGVSVEADKAELAKPDVPFRRKMAITHRIACKEILTTNIHLCNITMNVLANLQIHFDKGQTQFTKAECKRIYMQRVNQYESSDEEVMLNRLRIRKYIRELILNQSRVAEKIANATQNDEKVQNIVD